MEEQDGLRHRRSPEQDAGSLHIEEERAGPATGRYLTLALFRVLLGLLAVLAADGKGKCLQTLLCDFLAALEAVAVSALLQSRQRVVDPAERLRLHLDERQLDVFLNIGLRALTRIEDFRKLRDLASGPDVAHLVLNLRLKLAPTAQQHLLELVIAAVTGRCGCGGLSVFHDAAPCVRAVLGPCAL